MNEQEERAAVIAEALSWVGTPYHHKARIKGAGVDCANLLIEVFSACDLIPRIDVGDYPPDWMMHRDEERFLGWVEKYAHPVEHPQPGDIALYKFGRCVSHGAIISAWPVIIHAFMDERGVVIGNGLGGKLEKRFFAYYSLWGN